MKKHGLMTVKLYAPQNVSKDHSGPLPLVMKVTRFRLILRLGSDSMLPIKDFFGGKITSVCVKFVLRKSFYFLADLIRNTRQRRHNVLWILTRVWKERKKERFCAHSVHYMFPINLHWLGIFSI